MFKRRASMKKILPHSSTTTSNGTTQGVIQSPIQNLLSAEKAVLSSLQKLSVDYAKSAEALRTWGLSEDNDLGGILTASTSLLNHFSLALSQWVTLGHSMQRQLEVMAKMGESLDTLKQRRNAARQKVDETINQMNKMLNPDNKIFLLMHAEALKHLRKDVLKMDEDIKSEETVFNDHKQSALKSWMRLKFSGLYDCCEKGMIAGNYGKLAVTELGESKDIIQSARNPHLQNKIKNFTVEADQHVKAVGLPVAESHNKDRDIQESSNALSAGSNNSPQTGHKESPPPHPPPKSQPQPHYDHAPSYPQNVQPFRNGKRHFPPERQQDSSFPPSSGPPYAPSYQQQQLSQGTANRSWTSPSSQRLPRVDEDAVDDFGVNGAVPRSYSCTSVNNSRPSSPSESSGHSLRDLVVGGRYLNGGGSSYSVASSHLQSPPPSDQGRHSPVQRTFGASESAGRYLSQDPSSLLGGRRSPGDLSVMTGTSHWQDRVQRIDTRSPNPSELGEYHSHDPSTSHWQNHHPSGRLPKRPLPTAPINLGGRHRDGNPLHLQIPINTGPHSLSESGGYPSQDSLSLDGSHRGLSSSEGTSHWTPSRFSSVTGSTVTSEEGMIRARRSPYNNHQSMNSWGGIDPEESPPAYMPGDPESLVTPNTGPTLGPTKGKW